MDELRNVVEKALRSNDMDHAIELLSHQSLDQAYQLITDLAAYGALTGPQTIQLTKSIIPTSEYDRFGIHTLP
jgi:hypothetical protein